MVKASPLNFFLLTSSSRFLCSFCSSMRFCLSANSKRLCSSFCCCSSCCRRCASERSLLASWRRRKSRLRVDSPGMLMIELETDQWEGRVVNYSRDVKLFFGKKKVARYVFVYTCTYVRTLTLVHPCLFLHPPLHCHCIRTRSHLMQKKKEKIKRE